MTKQEQKQENEQVELATKIKEEELEKLKKFDVDVRSLIQGSGKLTLERVTTNLRLDSLNSQLDAIEDTYKTLLQDRETYVKDLIAKYGSGISINPDDGSIIR